MADGSQVVNILYSWLRINTYYNSRRIQRWDSALAPLEKHYSYPLAM